MKILNLQAENIKRLVAVEITPDGNIVEITGKNRQGKTSVLDAIWWAITGKSNVQAQPIRSGEQSATIVLNLGGEGERTLKVTRTFKLRTPRGEETTNDPTDFTTSVKIETEDGATYGKPQEMLDGLIGALAFDPLEFLRMKPADQLNTLKNLVGLDFSDMEAADKADRLERTDINREAESYRAQANAILVDADAPTERVSVDDLIQELEEAGQKATDIQTELYSRRNAQNHIDGIAKGLVDKAQEIEDTKISIEQMQERLLYQEAALKSGQEELEAQQKALAELPPIAEAPDTAAVRQKIAEAQAANAIIDKAERRKDLSGKAEVAEAKSKAITERMKDRKAEKAKLIGAADMPVDGLDFGEDGVMLRGVPFEQASDAEQLETSIAIAAAKAPELRVIRVRDGSLMDADAMKALAAFAEAKDMQVWVETVSSGRPGAIVIEDGHVKDEAAQPSLV